MEREQEHSQPRPVEGELDAAPAAVTDEELFCDYLEARVQQALETLNGAREEMAAKPDDFNRSMLVMRRVYELRDLKRQLEHQRGRLNAAREAAGLAPAPSPVIGSATATTEFRTAQTEQAAKVMAALSVKLRTCPQCQAPILNDGPECGCRTESPGEFAAGADAHFERDTLS